ncbi:MAG: hypothetical protein CMF38_07295 [Legionellaceae bacterium]|nr:hypothetical protein [Legionellaceae bacterium]HCA89644.1 hypothetical protein [Legionellales bacterium]
MKKTLLLPLMLSPLLLLGGCTATTSSYYTPAYNRDYVYTTGYNGYRPYYRSQYGTRYYNTRWNRQGYWRGNRYWTDRRYYRGGVY